MPTPFTGDPTAAEAPSGAPEPEGAPIVNLPDDGDPPNASTYIQAYKALADWVAYALKPRAKASDWAKPIQRYRSAAGHRRFNVDHQGFPGGHINSFDECWPEIQVLTSSSGTAGATTATWARGWLTTIYRAFTGAGTGQATVHQPLAGTWPFSRYVGLETSDDAGSYTVLNQQGLCLFATDTSIVMSWYAKITLTGTNVYMGFNAPGVIGAHGAIAQFYYSGGNWVCETDDGTTLGTTDSGVAADANWHRFRIEYNAANVDDAGTERVLFLIDEVVVANRTANMPSVAASPLVIPRFQQVNVTGGAGPRTMLVSPVRYRNNMYQDLAL